MSKNSKFVVSNKSPSGMTRKCGLHIYSHSYAANVRRHDEIFTDSMNILNNVNMDTSINIKMVFHFLAPNGSYNRDRVLSRIHDIVQSLNDDFNNYTSNPNTMNNFRYKSIVNQVFLGNMQKQNIYLGPDYMRFLPFTPSNITFDLGEVYYYPVKTRLNLSRYDDVKELEIEQQVIKQYIHHNRADAIHPEHFMNVWIIDMVETDVMGFSNFPWETIDNYHGIVMNRRVFFPEDYSENSFNMYKTMTHQVGHYLGLVHVSNQNLSVGFTPPSNLNTDTNMIIDREDAKVNIPNRLNVSFDPMDQNTNKNLHSDNQYNPLFMNFMDLTLDKYVTMFTSNQIKKMRYLLFEYRPKINSLTFRIRLPIPKYNPDTDTLAATVSGSSISRNPPSVPSYEKTEKPEMPIQHTHQHTHQMPPMQPMPPMSSMPPMQSMRPMHAPHQMPMQQTADRFRSVNDLIPNLSGGFNQASNHGTAQNQIISNIQSNLPNDTTNSFPSNNPYTNMQKEQSNYNSDNGYGMNYRYDPYNTQQQRNQMLMYGQMQQYYTPEQMQRIAPNNPQTNPQMNPQMNAQTNPQMNAQMSYYYPSQYQSGYPNQMPQTEAKPQMTSTARNHSQNGNRDQVIIDVDDNTNAPTNLIERVTRVDQQLKNIRESMNNENDTVSGQPITINRPITSNQSVTLNQPITSNDNQSVKPGMRSAKVIQTGNRSRFFRSKPINNK